MRERERERERTEKRMIKLTQRQRMGGFSLLNEQVLTHTGGQRGRSVYLRGPVQTGDDPML